MDEALSPGDRDLDVAAAAVTCESKATKAQERQRFLFFEESCHQPHEADNFPSPGLLQVVGRREPIGSMSSMEVNVDALELLDVSDHEVFAGSGGEDNTEASPVPEKFKKKASSAGSPARRSVARATLVTRGDRWRERRQPPPPPLPPEEAPAEAGFSPSGGAGRRRLGALGGA
ncbi:dysbindin-like isoform X2 [Lethenteron reissneri]|uniref:dysbindin-like isoform X2 n=1 Tax=Lethenteron reissneri TaxID=7753 RepID=UPI002AB7A04B|nr:dysbindin-like isoform X2 [Lethenteron reissneri]